MNKEDKTSRLYAALGDVEDYYVAEAAAYMARQQNLAKLQKKRRARTLRGVLIAAAVLLTLTFAVGALGRALGSKTNAEPHVSESQDERVPGEAESLDGLLRAAAREPYRTEAPDFFSGTVTVYWKLPGSDVLYAKPLGTEDLELTHRSFTRAEPIRRGGEERIRLWICDGAGRVVTPYLLPGEGNVGFGELFDYDPEIIPPTSFVNEFRRFFTT